MDLQLDASRTSSKLARSSENLLLYPILHGVGFLHLEIAILEGKTAEEKKTIGTKVRDLIVEHLGDAAKGRPITIEVRDIHKEFILSISEKSDKKSKV